MFTAYMFFLHALLVQPQVVFGRQIKNNYTCVYLHLQQPGDENEYSRAYTAPYGVETSAPPADS